MGGDTSHASQTHTPLWGHYVSPHPSPVEMSRIYMMMYG